jgi:hypothetical protein
MPSDMLFFGGFGNLSVLGTERFPNYDIIMTFLPLI